MLDTYSNEGMKFYSGFKCWISTTIGECSSSSEDSTYSGLFGSVGKGFGSESIEIFLTGIGFYGLTVCLLLFCC